MTQINFIEKPNTEKEINSVLHPLVSEWFNKKFGKFADSQKYFLRYLSKVGVDVVTKPLKKILLDKNDLMFTHSKDGYVYKANFDVEMTADMLLETEDINRIIIFSGDSDFAYLVKKLKSLGRGTTVVSSRKTIAWELKLEKAEIIFLEDIESQIRKT